MKVYFENQCGEVVGTVTDYQFSLEAAGSYWRVPSFVVAMPDGTFKVVDIEKCRHKTNVSDGSETTDESDPDTAGNIVIISEEYMQDIYNKHGAVTPERYDMAAKAELKNIASLLGKLPDRLPDGCGRIGMDRVRVCHFPNGDEYIGFDFGISVKRTKGNRDIAAVYYDDELIGTVSIINEKD